MQSSLLTITIGDTFSKNAHGRYTYINQDLSRLFEVRPLSASYFHRWEQLDSTSEMSLFSPRSHHRLTVSLSLSHGVLCSGYNHGDVRGIGKAGE